MSAARRIPRDELKERLTMRTVTTLQIVKIFPSRDVARQLTSLLRELGVSLQGTGQLEINFACFGVGNLRWTDAESSIAARIPSDIPLDNSPDVA